MIARRKRFGEGAESPSRTGIAREAGALHGLAEAGEARNVIPERRDDDLFSETFSIRSHTKNSW